MGATIHYTVANAGANIVLDGTNITDGTTIEIYAPSNVVLVGNWHFEISPVPIDGTTIHLHINLNTDIDLNGHTFDISGVFFSQTQISVYGGFVGFQFFDNAFLDGAAYYTSFLNGGFLDGSQLLPTTVPLTSLANLASAQIIVGSSGNVPTAVGVTGDVTISNVGVTAIGAGVIVNADINASAAIAVTKLAALTASSVVKTDASGFLTTTGADIVNADINASAAIALSKLAALTASQVAVTTAGGVITTAATLSATLGGTALNTSASTGVPIVTAGTWSVGPRTEVMHLQVSFETGYLGDFKITMPFAGTVTSIYAYATKVIAGTDAGTIVPKNNGGTTMGSGTITFAASDARGTAYTAAPATNNTFAAADILTFTTAKTTAGGVVQLSITYTRTT